MKQMPAKDMREVESVCEDAVPTSMDVRDGVTGAAKYWQVGTNACHSLLTSALTGVTPDPAGIFVMDLFVRNGDFTEAFCSMKTDRSNIHHPGFCESQDEIIT